MVRHDTRRDPFELRAGVSARRLDRSRSRRTEQPGGMRFVDDEPGIVSFAQLGERGEIRRVTIHAEDALRENQSAACTPRASELSIELVEIEVPVHEHSGA